MKNAEPNELKTYKSMLQKNYFFQRLTFENMHKGPVPRAPRYLICGPIPISLKLNYHQFAFISEQKRTTTSRYR